jgi:adenosylmethionine-8-amino-7-oxononanoate aminotransferase
MREVCDDYGILLIFDEVMCGMGRTGFLHAWQKDNVVPDIQIIGKGLAAGFQPISGLLIGNRVANAFENGPSNGAFQHGHTFQNHSVGCAAALAVQSIVEKDKLIENVKEKGALLGNKLKSMLGSHRHVGDIRGEGLFWAVSIILRDST